MLRAGSGSWSGWRRSGSLRWLESCTWPPARRRLGRSPLRTPVPLRSQAPEARGRHRNPTGPGRLLVPSVRATRQPEFAKTSLVRRSRRLAHWKGTEPGRRCIDRLRRADRAAGDCVENAQGGGLPKLAGDEARPQRGHVCAWRWSPASAHSLGHRDSTTDGGSRPRAYQKARPTEGVAVARGDESIDVTVLPIGGFGLARAQGMPWRGQSRTPGESAFEAMVTSAQIECLLATRSRRHGNGPGLRRGRAQPSSRLSTARMAASRASTVHWPRVTQDTPTSRRRSAWARPASAFPRAERASRDDSRPDRCATGYGRFLLPLEYPAPATGLGRRPRLAREPRRTRPARPAERLDCIRPIHRA